jgi:hypothetical protein
MRDSLEKETSRTEPFFPDTPELGYMDVGKKGIGPFFRGRLLVVFFAEAGV